MNLFIPNLFSDANICYSLQAERQSLAALIRPPSVPIISTKSDILRHPTSKPDDIPELLRRNPLAINQSLLDPTQASILNILGHSESRPKEASSKTTNSSSEIDTSILSISERLTRLSASLTPTLDSFATGIHNIEMFRQSADSLSSHILRICAQRLEERDALQGKNAGLSTLSGGKEDGKSSLQGTVTGGREDLSDILRALSRLERR